MPISILIVEDNQDMRETLASFLSEQNFRVMAVGSTEEGIDAIDENKFHLGLIDINLPGKSGFDMVEYIRDQENDMPLIALTARDGVSDKIKGFDTGLNDYVVKPFDLRELLARINVHLRTRGVGDDTAELTTKNFTLQPKSLRFFKNGEPVELTQIEFKIMHTLMQNEETVVKVDDLIESVWGEDDELVTPPIRIHIANLRKKINDKEYRIIKTIPGTGYIFTDE
jgi:DNA-binding response OmpR family regulator